MHPRVSLHQIALANETATQFLAFCADLGLRQCVLASPLVWRDSPSAAEWKSLRDVGPHIACINHPFALHPDLPQDKGGARDGLFRAIDMAADLDTPAIYMLTGGRGHLDWEGAAARFIELIVPCQERAREAGIALLIENAPATHADIHIAHSLPDVTHLARMAGLGVCIELHACWAEAQLPTRLQDAMPITGWVQVSDYVLGDRTNPCRAVPGDGSIPLESLLRSILDMGYKGPFDLELIGPRIEAEGHRAACRRAAHYLSDILERLGA